MSTEVFSSNAIHTGFWIDHHYANSASGLTLTLSTSSSVYLIAFLALFVKVSGNYSWDLFNYIVFQARSTLKPRNALHHQTQALLRTRLTDTKTAMGFVRLFRAWNRKAAAGSAQTLLFAFVGFFHLAAFIICGIFSSKVAQAHSSVLLRNGTCGEAVLDVTNITATSLWLAMESNSYLTASIFSQDCYSFNDTSAKFSSPICDAPGRNLVHWNITENISCPFQSHMCRDDLVVGFDTGLIDSVSPICL